MKVYILNFSTFEIANHLASNKPLVRIHKSAQCKCYFQDRNRSLTVLESSSNEKDNVCINDQPSTPKSRRKPRRALADKTNTDNKTAARTAAATGISAETIGGGEKSIVKNAKVDSDRDSHCANNDNEDNNKEKTKQQARPEELQTERELKRRKRNSESDIDSECNVSSDDAKVSVTDN